ncbi:MAG TPA: sigma-70 family RNA polymerase sigma factor [Gemmatimonadaceae bacterium]|nr:sigma-70 family RNA polymerase sigma factor [Gemmatimonadaceae bacterium]
MHPPDPPNSYPVQGQVISLASPDDAALVARMGAGDEQALGLFYDRWEHTVRTTAVRMVTDSMEAEDVVEDVFWQAWRQASRFDPARGGAGTWLLTIARSRALDRLRSMRRSRDDAGIDDLVESGSEQLASVESSPIEDVERGERSQIIREALRTLPAEQRESLELAYFEGLSQSEIAERTGLPLGTVKTRMRLALQKLRERLGDLNVGAT